MAEDAILGWIFVDRTLRLFAGWKDVFFFADFTTQMEFTEISFVVNLCNAALLLMMMINF